MFDAWKIVDGRCTADFDASDWDNEKCVDIDVGLLQARRSVPVKLLQRMKPAAVLNKPGGKQYRTSARTRRAYCPLRQARQRVLNCRSGSRRHWTGKATFTATTCARHWRRWGTSAMGKERFYRPGFTFFSYRYVRNTFVIYLTAC
jgi:hypothetical protein